MAAAAVAVQAFESVQAVYPDICAHDAFKVVNLRLIIVDFLDGDLLQCEAYELVPGNVVPTPWEESMHYEDASEFPMVHAGAEYDQECERCREALGMLRRHVECISDGPRS